MFPFPRQVFVVLKEGGGFLFWSLRQGVVLSGGPLVWVWPTTQGWRGQRKVIRAGLEEEEGSFISWCKLTLKTSSLWPYCLCIRPEIITPIAYVLHIATKSEWTFCNAHRKAKNRTRMMWTPTSAPNWTMGETVRFRWKHFLFSDPMSFLWRHFLCSIKTHHS